MGKYDKSDIVQTLLIGTVLGGALGLLLAPKKGKNLRESIIDRAKLAVEDIESKGENEIDQIKKLIEDKAKNLSALKEDGKDKAKGSISNFLSNLREYIEEQEGKLEPETKKKIKRTIQRAKK